MAQLDFSSTLKNMKFMQRNFQKEENSKKAEILKPEVGFQVTSSPAPTRRCVVIIEGDPHPGTVRGRMSFQSFNPSIDKLNEEATNTSEKRASSTIRDQNAGTLERCGAAAVEPRDASPSQNSSLNSSDAKRKRNPPEEGTSTRSPRKLKVMSSIDEGQPSSRNNSKGPLKKKRHGKLDWNVLRPPKGPKPYKG